MAARENAADEIGGVRIEDTVVVTGSGCRLLTGVTKEMRIV